MNLLQNTPHSILFLGDHVYKYNLKEQTFNIATEQEGQDIIGTLYLLAIIRIILI